jgi:hypothetical protein
MNPFDLPGPEFLVFYIVLAALTLAALVLHRRAAESAGSPVTLSHPYQVAYLRGGWREALSVAVRSALC